MDTVERGARHTILGALLAAERAAEQPPLLAPTGQTLSAAVASLAPGGAERIVLDWASSCAARVTGRLLVLRDVACEWPLPRGVTVTRLRGDVAALERAGAEIAGGANPVVLCHLLTREERDALRRGGAIPIPVLHNAMAGWREAAADLEDCSFVLAVSRHAADELRSAGWRGRCEVVRHVPRTPVLRGEAREAWRARWGLPHDALVIGMVGAMKPQKAYPRALRVLAALIARRDAFLVIVGGPVGRDGALAWAATVAQAQRLGVAELVRLPGFVTPATDCLGTFDIVLNTSRYEGLSIATLEALAAGLPVIASAVGGQGELGAPGLTLMEFDAPDDDWADAIERALAGPPALPAWRGVPTQRLWTLFHLLGPLVSANGGRVLFVTANLNAGGAQRSLVNLALALKDKLQFEIAVCGDSSSAHFGAVLADARVRVQRTAATRDCFDHAEAIVHEVASSGFGAVAFWNVDAKVKLIVAKALGATHVRLIDVSPGAYAFEEMDATRAFQTWIAYSQHDYYRRLDRLVMKHRGEPPRGLAKRSLVIPNGVRATPRATTGSSAPRIVMSGRIAPSKFILEAVAAMRLLWKTHSEAELHLLGTAETRHAAYASAILEAIGDELGRRVFLHGEAFDAPQRVARYSLALVLGEHQGSPNAVLEALAAGLPVVANDSGGTCELVIDGRTGVLLSTRDPDEIAGALARLIEQPKLAQRLARAGRRDVERRFSMKRMAAAYLKLLTCG